MNDDDCRKAHRHSSAHRDEILQSKICGCFYCRTIFSPEKIETWLAEEGTALCPYCEVDSVIGDASGYEINIQFLREMHRKWF